MEQIINFLEENDVSFPSEEAIKLLYVEHITSSQIKKKQIEAFFIKNFNLLSEKQKKFFLKWFYNRNTLDFDFLKQLAFNSNKSFFIYLSPSSLKQNHWFLLITHIALEFPENLNKIRYRLLSLREFRFLHFLYKKAAERIQLNPNPYLKDFIKSAIDFYLSKENYSQAYSLVKRSKNQEIEDFFFERISSLKTTRKLLRFLEENSRGRHRINKRINFEKESRIYGRLF